MGHSAHLFVGSASARFPAFTPTPSRTRRTGWVIAVMVAAQMLIWLDNSILNIAVHTLADPVRGLGAGPDELGWAVSAYSLVLASAMFTGGALADRFGPRSTLVAGLVVFSATSAVAAFAADPAVLIVARGGMGAGSALLMPATLSIIVHVSAPSRRTAAIAIWASSSGVGVAIGPVVGGALLDRFWWGSVFLVNVPFVVLCLIGVWWVVPRVRYPQRRVLDPVGLALSTAGLGSLVYGVITGGGDGSWRQPGTLVPVLCGIALLGAFAVTQYGAAEPSFDVRLFGRRQFTGGCLALLFAFLGLAGQLFYFAFYLQGIRGLSPLAAGVTMLPAAVGIIAGNQVSPALLRWIPTRWVIAAGLATVIATFASCVLVDAHTPMAWLLLMLLAQGLGMGLISTPVTATMMASLPPERTGAGSALNSAMRQVGATLGVAVLGSVLTAAYRRGITPSLGTLPSQVREQALVSAETARSVAAAAARPELAAAADRAFLHAMDVTAVWTAALTAVGLLVVVRMLRPDPAPTQRPSTQRPSTQRPSTQRPSTQRPSTPGPSTPGQG